MIRFQPAEDEIGARLDVVLARRAGVTRVLAQRAIREGDVTVAGRAVRPSHRLEPGEDVKGEVPAPSFAPPGPEDIPLDVRYSDERVLVVSKPPGLVTHPARGHESGTLVNALVALEGPLAGLGSVRPGIVHRLDKDTSGLLLVARDDAARDYLVDALRRRVVERRYLALVRGGMPAPSGTVDAPLARHPARRRHFAVVPSGRPSVTHYKVLAASAGAALLEVTLETGRTHQIRVHLAHIGHAVLGDRAYGGATELARRLGLARPFLHAHRLAFPHPAHGERVTVEDPLPPDLLAALEAAGLPPPGPPSAG
jgi:23S rRNA pseudouridine1911/1915/1917 synthase